MDFGSLITYLDNCNIKYDINENTALLVSIRVGGLASIVAYPDTIEKLCRLIKFVNNKFKYFILANGTNTYFCDSFDGIIISTKNINNIKLDKNEIIAECGASLTGCAVYAYEEGLSGLEFAYGIPGTLGGGIYMNASAFGGKISDVIKECLVYDVDKESIYTLCNKNLNFSDKCSIFVKEKLIILKAVLTLDKGIKADINKKMKTYMQKRISTQPLDIPNAGSAFKRPKGDYASRLIDEAGLKGYNVGDAQISKKHAGFIVNNGSASSSDINKLIKYIKNEIKNKFNVILEEEIIYVE